MDMDPTNPITGAEPSAVPVTPARPILSSLGGAASSKVPAVRAGIALGVALVVAIGSAVVMGATPSGNAGGQSGVTGQAAPSGSPQPEKSPRDGKGPARGFGRPFGGPGGFGPSFGGILPFTRPGLGRFEDGVGAITITSITGSSVSLATVDGWTRTITVAADTKVSRGGRAASLADLHVGDAIRIRQKRNDDGSFTVTAIDVLLPRVVGTVAATTADTITVTTGDGRTVTVHVAAATTIQVRGVDKAKLTDVAVGMVVMAVGERRADGSIDATGVLAGQLKANGRGPKDPKPDRPKASDAPAASAAAG